MSDSGVFTDRTYADIHIRHRGPASRAAAQPRTDTQPSRKRYACSSLIQAPVLANRAAAKRRPPAVGTGRRIIARQSLALDAVAAHELF